MDKESLTLWRLKVNMSDEVKVSSSVPASAFGWDFQVNAAIILMLINIKQADSIKVEGATDDIEINLENGNVIYSQAKAVFDRDNVNPVDKNLEKSLKSLYNDSLKSNVEQLIYITNSPNPFNNRNTLYAFSSGLNICPYSNLPQACRNKIDNLIKKHNYIIDNDKFSVYVLQFSKNTDDRYKVIKEKANEIINSFNLGIMDIGNDMLDIWQNEFFHNASQPHDVTIKKSEMLWPLVVFMCELNREDEIIRDFDKALFEEIEHKYKAIINNKSELFSFAVRVITSFDEYDVHNSSTQKRAQAFISNCWKEYEKEFNFPGNEEKIKENVIKITLSNILNKRFKINQIKIEANL
jgi:hypothetical protein